MPQRPQDDFLVKAPPAQVRKQLAKALQIRRNSFPVAVFLQIVFQGPFVSDFIPDLCQSLLNRRGCDPPSKQGISHSIRAPAIPGDPAKSKIIRVIPIIEKVQLFQAVHHMVDGHRPRDFGEPFPQFSTA